MDDEVLQAVRSGDLAAYVAVIKDRAAVVASRLPKPDGSVWTTEDVEDLVSSFYESAAYEHSVLSAHDDDSLRGLVYTGLANLVRAELRRTDRGRLHRRVRELLASEGLVEGPTKFWRRADDPDRASTTTEYELVEATWSIDVPTVKWRADAKRNRPFAEKTTFMELLGAIYDTAAGALHIDVLVDVLARRLGVGPTSAIEQLELVEEELVAHDPGPVEHVLDHERELDAAVAAAELWGQLRSRERMGPSVTRSIVTSAIAPARHSRPSAGPVEIDRAQTTAVPAIVTSPVASGDVKSATSLSRRRRRLRSCTATSTPEDRTGQSTAIRH